MAKNARDIEWDNLNEAIPAFLTMVVMPFTFSIPNGLAAGLGSYIILWLLTGQWWTQWRTQMLQHSYSTVACNADDEDGCKGNGSESPPAQIVVERDSFYDWNDPEHAAANTTQLQAVSSGEARYIQESSNALSDARVP